MGYFSLWHWIILIGYVFVMAYPTGRILQRLGFNKWLGLLSVVPFVNILGLWALSFMPWPDTRDGV